jgi:hypothetical protein
MLADTSCAGCSRAPDAYRLGILKYDDVNKNAEDGSLRNNRTGLYNFIRPERVSWVPYDRGYYAEVAVAGFSEFWFFDNGPSFTYPPAEASVNFTARRTNLSNALLEWQSVVDTMVIDYELQRAVNSQAALATIHQRTARQEHGSVAYQFNDAPPAQIGDTVYYRLKWRLLDGSAFYSPVRKLYWSRENQISSIFPNPNANGMVHIRYTANPGTMLELTLTDVAGRQVLKQRMPAPAWDNDYLLTAPLAPGLYILKGTLGDTSFQEKLIYR